MNATFTLPMHEVLWALQSGETLTVQRAFKMFHTTELRKIVSRLRRRGYDIRAKKLLHECPDGRRVWYHEYYLNNEKNHD